jgi:hypothetical protein
MVLAKIKLRIGDNEIEVDSRDFYVDNKTIGEVIENIAAHLQTKNVRVITGDFPVQDSIQVHALNSLENAEVYEPEFSNPTSVSPKELRGKLLILSKNYFFDQPRTAPETVNELRERGWIASPLDVSKTLSKMAFNKELLKNKQGKRSYYFVKEALLAN